jgi:hypothetical protein
LSDPQKFLTVQRPNGYENSASANKSDGCHREDRFCWRAALGTSNLKVRKSYNSGSGCGLLAGAGLTAMGIESFVVCSLLILHGLGKSEKSEKRSEKRYLAA